MQKIIKFCVYKHTSPSGKCYIGITSQSVSERWGSNGCNYTITLSSGKYKHPKFANAIIKYGWENFQHEILHENITKEEACLLEKEYIQYYKNNNLSYNITDGGEGVSGIQFSEETIEKMRITHTGKKQSLETIQKRVKANTGKKRTDTQKTKRSKPVGQFNLQGELITTYFGCREASRNTGINSSHISQCCNNIKNRKTAGGYIWKWV